MTTRYRIEITEQALADLAAIGEWIRSEAGAQAARQMINAMLERIDTLEQFPERGALVPELELLGRDGFRTLPAPPYRLLYRVHEARVTVRMIYHMRRDFAALLEERMARDRMSRGESG